jgi:uncharacterized protein YgiM (DUF1202 family)
VRVVTLTPGGTVLATAAATGQATAPAAGATIVRPAPSITPPVPATARATIQTTAPAASQPQARIIIPFLNVRSGPGANYSGIGQVKSGDIVIILGRNEDRKWWAIQSPSGLRGWILNNPAYIAVSGDISRVPLAAAKPSPTPG